MYGGFEVNVTAYHMFMGVAMTFGADFSESAARASSSNVFVRLFDVKSSIA